MSATSLPALLRRRRPLMAEPAGRGLLAMLAVAGLAVGPTVPRAAPAGTASAPVRGGATRLAVGPLERVAASAAGAPSSAVAPAPQGVRVGELDAAVTRALGDAAERSGVAVLDRRTGTRYAHAGDRMLEMASTTKVLIAVAFLAERRADGRAVTDADRRRVEAMIRYSDNDSATRLRDDAGGASGVAQVARRLGMPRTADHALAMPSWGSVQTTADEQVTLLAHLAAGGDGLVHPDDCAYVLSEMRQVTPEQRWGAGVVDSAGVHVALKNGWLPSRHVGWVVNTIGVVQGDGRDYVVAVYEHGAGSEGAGIDRKNAVVRAVHEALARPLVP